MLDTKVINSLNFNSVSGTLVRSHAESNFVKFHMTSQVAASFFGVDATPTLKGKKVSVLQTMICPDNQFLVEYIFI